MGRGEQTGCGLEIVCLMVNENVCVQGYWGVGGAVSGNLGEGRHRTLSGAEGMIISCEAMGVG